MDSPPLYPFSLQRMRINYWAGIQLHTRPIIEPADWHLPTSESPMSFLRFFFAFFPSFSPLPFSLPLYFSTPTWGTRNLPSFPIWNGTGNLGHWNSLERACPCLSFIIPYIVYRKREEGIKGFGTNWRGTIIVPFFLNFLNKWEGINDEYRRQR